MNWSSICIIDPCSTVLLKKSFNCFLHIKSVENILKELWYFIIHYQNESQFVNFYITKQSRMMIFTENSDHKFVNEIKETSIGYCHISHSPLISVFLLSSQFFCLFIFFLFYFFFIGKKKILKRRPQKCNPRYKMQDEKLTSLQKNKESMSMRHTTQLEPNQSVNYTRP